MDTCRRRTRALPALREPTKAPAPQQSGDTFSSSTKARNAPSLPRYRSRSYLTATSKQHMFQVVTRNSMSAEISRTQAGNKLGISGCMPPASNAAHVNGGRETSEVTSTTNPKAIGAPLHEQPPSKLAAAASQFAWWSPDSLILRRG